MKGTCGDEWGLKSLGKELGVARENAGRDALRFFVFLVEVLDSIGRPLGVDFGLGLHALVLLLGTQDLALQDSRKQSEGGHVASSQRTSE